MKDFDPLFPVFVVLGGLVGVLILKFALHLI